MNLSDFANKVFSTKRKPATIKVFIDDDALTDYAEDGDGSYVFCTIHSAYDVSTFLQEKAQKAEVVHFFATARDEIAVLIEWEW